MMTWPLPAQAKVDTDLCMYCRHTRYMHDEGCNECAADKNPKWVWEHEFGEAA